MPQMWMSLWSHLAPQPGAVRTTALVIGILISRHLAERWKTPQAFDALQLAKAQGMSTNASPRLMRWRMVFC